MTEAAADTAPDQIEEFLGTSRRPRWRRWMRYWLPALSVLALVLAVATCAGDGDEPEYVTQPVVEHALDLTVTATGNLRPTNQIQVGSEVSGRIDRIFVDVNDRVSQGQVLAQINTDVIQDQIRQSQANLNAAKAQVDQAQATLDVDVAQLERLRGVYEVSGGKVPSRVELEQADAAVKRDRAAMASAIANVRAFEAQLSTSLTSRNRAVIRSPVSGVVLARQVEPGQTVAASFNTPTLFIIAEDLAAMQLRVDIDEADVGQVREGQKAAFTVDAYPGRRFPAQVERVDQASTNTAATATQQTSSVAGAAGSVVNYEARLSVSNQQGLLRPGMTATATIATQSTGKQMLVPNSALRFQPDAPEKEAGSVLNPEIGLQQNEQQATIGVGSRQRVFVIGDDGALRPIEVVTGQSDGRLTVVRSNELKSGMRIVTGKKASEK